MLRDETIDFRRRSGPALTHPARKIPAVNIYARYVHACRAVDPLSARKTGTECRRFTMRSPSCWPAPIGAVKFLRRRPDLRGAVCCICCVGTRSARCFVTSETRRPASNRVFRRDERRRASRSDVAHQKSASPKNKYKHKGRALLLIALPVVCCAFFCLLRPLCSRNRFELGIVFFYRGARSLGRRASPGVALPQLAALAALPVRASVFFSFTSGFCDERTRQLVPPARSSCAPEVRDIESSISALAPWPISAAPDNRNVDTQTSHDKR